MDTQKRCASCAVEIPLDAKKCPHCRARQPGPSTFYRPRDGKVIAGVCAGIARELGWDQTVVRIGFAVMALISVGIAFWGYVILWAITPTEPFGDTPLARVIDKVRRLFSPSPRSLPIHEKSDPQTS